MGEETTPTSPSGDGHTRPLPPGPPSTRADRWLWAVRLLKTRAEAAQACRGGHVRINDQSAKAASPVRVGDIVKVTVHGQTRIVEVSHVLEKRVGAPVAQRCYVDKTPAPPPQQATPLARRDRGAGRPTKRDRRVIDRTFGSRES